MAETTLSELAGWADRKAEALAHPDFRPALQEIGEALYASVYAGFQGSHDPDGRPWLPLKDSFAKPLFGTQGKMIARVLAAHRQARLTPDSLTVEVDSDIAALHNLGRKKRPQREFLGFGENLLERSAAFIAGATAAELVRD